MKSLAILVATIGLVMISLTAQARPMFPRDLKCETESGSILTLKSNNSLWSENRDHKVSFLVDHSSEMPAIWTNLKATHTRGNDTGIREYIFLSKDGENFHVTLQFYAPFGQAVGIKNFSVRSQSIQFSHSQRRLRSNVCNVTFYSRVDI